MDRTGRSIFGIGDLDRYSLAEVTALKVSAGLECRETASRVRTRIGAVMDWATALQPRSGPADWQILQHALPDRGKAARHHAAASSVQPSSSATAP